MAFGTSPTRKADEGSPHADRDAQFEHINAKVRAAQAAGQPTISVDTKKKELVGNFRNGGSDYRPKGEPQRVNVHDFADKELGKVAPYGVYDIAANTGWAKLTFIVSVKRSLMSASRTIPRSLPSPPFGSGSKEWGGSVIPMHAN